jgi:hypothetical protein
MKRLIPLIPLVLLPLSGACFAAELYKWVDEKGVTTYGEKPPAGRAATPVDTSSRGVIETGGQFERKSQPDRPATRMPEPAPRPAPVASAPRGMDFSVYALLQRGMTEGELLQRAGKPDHMSIDNFDIQKTYYYFPTSANPYTTAVILRSGRIHEIDRVKKF